MTPNPSSNSITIWNDPSIYIPTTFLPPTNALAQLTRIQAPDFLVDDAQQLLRRMTTTTITLPDPTDDVSLLVRPHSPSPYSELESPHLDRLTYAECLARRSDPPAESPDDSDQTEEPILDLDDPWPNPPSPLLPSPKKVCRGLRDPAPTTPN